MEAAIKRRLPLVVGLAAGLTVLLLVGPVAAAVVLLRSSSDAVGPVLGVQLFIAALVLLLSAGAGLAARGITRLLIRLLSGRGRR